jgi:hypothetical protein
MKCQSLRLLPDHTVTGWKCMFTLLPLKNFSSNSALVISISTVLSTCFA